MVRLELINALVSRTLGGVNSGEMTKYYHADGHEYILLSEEERMKTYHELVLLFGFLLMDLVNVIFFVVNQAKVLSVNQGNPWVTAVLYVGLFVFKFKMVREYVRNIRMVKAELDFGILVDSKRSRLYRRKKAKLEPTQRNFQLGEDEDIKTRILEHEINVMLRKKDRCEQVMTESLEDCLVVFYTVFMIFRMWEASAESREVCQIFFFMFVQILIRVLSISYRLSFFRDLKFTKRMMSDIYNEMERRQQIEASILDDFGTNVTEEEVDVVIDLKGLLLKEIEDARIRDVQILRFLRRVPKAEVKREAKMVVAGTILRYIASRERENANERARKLLLNDTSFQDISGVSQFIYAMPVVIDCSPRLFGEDYLAGYAYFDKNIDLASLVKFFGGERNQKRLELLIRGVVEWLRVILNAKSETDRKLYNFRLLINCETPPGTDDEDDQHNINEVFDIFRVAYTVLQRDEVFPFDMELVFYQPTEFHENLIQQVRANCHDIMKITICRNLYELMNRFEDGLIPVELGGGQDFGKESLTFNVKADPWDLRAVPFHAPSTHFGKWTKLSFFKDVTPEEHVLVSNMKKYIERLLEGRTTRVAPEAENRIESIRRKKLTFISRISLRQVTGSVVSSSFYGSDVASDVEEEGTAVEPLLESDKTNIEIHNDNVALTNNIRQANNLLFLTLEDLPPEVGSDLALLRILRHHNGSIFKATKTFFQVHQWRQEYGMDALNESIKKKDLSLDQDNNCKLLMEAMGASPLLSLQGADDDGYIVSLTMDQTKISPKAKAEVYRWDHATLDRTLAFMKEYLSIVATRLSYEHEQVVRVVEVACLTSFRSMILQNRRIITRSIHLRRYYINLFHGPITALLDLGLLSNLLVKARLRKISDKSGIKGVRIALVYNGRFEHPIFDRVLSKHSIAALAGQVEGFRDGHNIKHTSLLSELANDIDEDQSDLWDDFCEADPNQHDFSNDFADAFGGRKNLNDRLRSRDNMQL